jgi:uncharacterized cofD-like protein
MIRETSGRSPHPTAPAQVRSPRPILIAGVLALAGAALLGFGLAWLLLNTAWMWPWAGLMILVVGGGLLAFGWMRPTSAGGAAPIASTPAGGQTAPARETILASSPVLPPDNYVSVPSVWRAPDTPAPVDSPRIVAIGGGTGMPQLLRGLRAYTDHITAIVTVADDGGSSGRLRRQMGVLPPGDFRNNIAALSQAEELMTRLFQYRFADNDMGGNSSELAGHSFGNLFITTMAAVTGSFEAGLAESSRVLAVRGRVLPSTLENITLCAEICFTRPDGSEEWQTVEGESNITKAGGRIMRVFLKPGSPNAYPEVIRAILQADLIVAGPGSFFTSVMPNLLVPAVRDAICAAPAPRIYLCNVTTQPGETDGYTVSDHMRQLRYHAGDAFQMVLANDNYDPSQAPTPYGQWVLLPPPDEAHDYRLFTGDVLDERQPWRHNPNKLASRLMEVYQELRQATPAEN